MSERVIYDSCVFGFNGMEKDDEIHGVTGSFLSFKYRGYDSRIGRFWSVDPLAREFPHNSSYAFSENRVIDGIDLEGAEFMPRFAPEVVDQQVAAIKVVKAEYNNLSPNIKQGVSGGFQTAGGLITMVASTTYMIGTGGFGAGATSFGIGIANIVDAFAGDKRSMPKQSTLTGMTVNKMGYTKFAPYVDGVMSLTGGGTSAPFKLNSVIETINDVSSAYDLGKQIITDSNGTYWQLYRVYGR